MLVKRREFVSEGLLQFASDYKQLVRNLIEEAIYFDEKNSKGHHSGPLR